MNEHIMTQLSSLWTTADLCRLFDRTPMTITLWRRNKNLPTITIPGGLKPTVRFVPADVLAWAKANNIEVHRFVSEIASS